MVHPSDPNASRRRFLLGGASLLAGTAFARAQNPAPAPAAQTEDAGQDAVFSTDVKVVNVLASVRTKKGEIVKTLTRDDFAVAENGKPQKIQYFSRETDLPLTLGLMIDTSMSQQKVLDAERGASLRFLDQMLRENKDQVFVVQFDMAVMIPQGLTSSRKKLEETLARVDTPTNSDLHMQNGGGTLLYDAILKGSRDIMEKQQDNRRKAMIVMSDGVDTGSEAPLSAAVEAAQRADVMVYSILFSDEGYYNAMPMLGRHAIPLGGGPDGRGALMRLSTDTGGHFFEVSKREGIEQIFDAIQDELRSQYSIGYVSDTPVRVSEFRKLQVTVKTKGLIVQARDRYWARR